MSSLETQLLERQARLAALRKQRRPEAAEPQLEVQQVAPEANRGSLFGSAPKSDSARESAHTQGETANDDGIDEERDTERGNAPTFYTEEGSETIEAISLAIQNRFLNERSLAIQATLMESATPEATPPKPHHRLMEKLQAQTQVLEERTQQCLQRLRQQNHPSQPPS